MVLVSPVISRVYYGFAYYTPIKESDSWIVKAVVVLFLILKSYETLSV